MAGDRNVRSEYRDTMEDRSERAKSATTDSSPPRKACTMARPLNFMGLRELYDET